MLDKFSSTGFTMKINPDYYAKSSLRVPEVELPRVRQQRQPAAADCSDGTIDWAGISVIGVQQNYLAKSTDNKTWTTSAPYFSDNNVVGLWFNVTKAPLNDPAVRQAISYRDQPAAAVDRRRVQQRAAGDHHQPA